MPFTREDLVAWLRRARLATIATISADGSPQAALVGIGVTDDLRLVFDTSAKSRKHANLLRDPRVAVVVGGSGEQTLQYEGLASPVPPRGSEGDALREAYYLTWPDGRARRAWPDLAYWRVVAVWVRFTDYDADPVVTQLVG